MRVEQIACKYGSCNLKIVGDPNRLFDVPIAYYTSPVFSSASIGAKSLEHDKILEAYVEHKVDEDSHEKLD